MRVLKVTVLLMSIAFAAQTNCAQDSDTGELYVIRKVFVDRIPGANQSARFRSLLKSKLAAKGFVITNDEEKADAVLKGSLSLHNEKRDGDWFLNAKSDVKLASRRGIQLWHSSQFLSQNLSFGQRDLVQELTNHIANSLRSAWEVSLQASRDGRVEHAFMVWDRSDKPLTLESAGTKWDLSEELSKLKSLGLKGNLKITHTGIEGSGPSKLRVIIVMHQPLYEGPLEFSLSRQSPMFIIQMEDRWITDPSPIPFSKSKLRVLPISPVETGFTLDRENSGIQFQFSFKWPRE